MRTIYAIFAAAATLLASCVKEMPAGQVKADSPVFTAYVEQIETDSQSKAVLDGLVCKWEAGDEIYVTDGSEWAVYAATSVSEDGGATFEIKAGEPGLSSEEGTTYKAYYPKSIVQSDHSLALPQQSVNENGEVSPTAASAGKSTDNYTLSKFRANPMYSETTDGTLRFRNLCGLVKFHVTVSEGTEIGSTGDYAISQIIAFDSRNPLFGNIVIQNGKAVPADGAEGDFRRAAAKNNNSKWASCVHDFYMVLPPATYSNTDFLAVTNKKAIQSWVLKEGASFTVERNKIYNFNLVLDNVGENDLSGTGTKTANCYIPPTTTKGTVYRFRATKGCSQEIVEGIRSAGVLWRAQMSTSQADADKLGEVVVKDVSYKSGYIQFTTTNNQGNALIAAFDGPDCTGNILWSWHIWAPSSSSHPVLEQTYPSGAVVLDRNLGALYSDTDVPASKDVETAASSRYSAGYLYQWGRKDPFMGRVNNGSARGRWKAISSDRNLTFVKNGAPVTVETTVRNPNVFYGSTSGVWCADAEQPTWDGPEKSIYDPCPAGYRVWSASAFVSPQKSDFETNVHLISGTSYQNLGYNYKDALADGSYIFFSVNGQFNNKTGEYAYYITQSRTWVRDVTTSGKVGFLNLTNTAVADKATTLSAATYSIAQPQCSSYGMGVRCQKITDDDYNPIDDTEEESELLSNALPAMWEQSSSVISATGRAWVYDNKAYASLSTGKNHAYMSTFEAEGHTVTRSVLDSRYEAGNLQEGDGFLFTIPIKQIAAGTSLDFCTSMMTNSLESPKYWIFEYLDGGQWKSVAKDLHTASEDPSIKYSFFMKSDRSYASTFAQTFTIENEMKDENLQVRLRVAGNINGAGNTLTPTADAYVFPTAYSQVGCQIYENPSVALKDTKKVIIFGNSFTYNGSAHWLLKRIARTQGHEIDLRCAIRAGYTFSDHLGHIQGQTAIQEGGYDYAVMQDQSEQHSHYYTLSDESVLDGTKEIVRQLKIYSPEVEPVLENTWAFAYNNNYSGYGSYAAMDYALQMGCYQICNLTGCTESPIGWAYAKARDAGISLYRSDDNKHPNRNGAYLKACVNYLVLYGERFDANVTNEEIPATTAATLRSIAEDVVLNHQGPYIPVAQ